MSHPKLTNVIVARRLERIALGYSNAAEARMTLSEALGDMSSESIQRIYASLRAWSWKALNERRRDEDLRHWYDILKRTASFLRERHPAYAERVQVLHELLYESISVSETLPIQEIIKRLYVKEIIRTLARSTIKQVPRGRLRFLLDLKEANLSRVINLMLASGLLDRAMRGREALFRLTKLGTEVAEQLTEKSAEREAKPREYAILGISVRPKEPSQDRAREHAIVIPRNIEERKPARLYSKSGRWSEYVRVLRSETKSNMPAEHVHFHGIGLVEKNELERDVYKMTQYSIFGKEFPEDQPSFIPKREIVSGT